MRKLPFVSTLGDVRPFVSRHRSILDDGGEQVVVDKSASIGDANNISLTYGHDWLLDALARWARAKVIVIAIMVASEKRSQLTNSITEFDFSSLLLCSFYMSF